MKSIGLALAASLLMLATGCSEAKDLARDTANDAACSIAKSAMNKTAEQAKRAVREIGADPKSAERELTSLRDALKSLEAKVDGKSGGRVSEARKALDVLVEQADAAREGTPVDDQAVDDAQRDLDAAVEDFKNIC